MSHWPEFIQESDLAPGDRTVHPQMPEGIALHTVASREDPLFETAFALLDEEFGAKGEMETREVLARRLAWRPDTPVCGRRMLYELMLLVKDGECLGLRDHTAIASEELPEIVVHLSHVLIVPKWRRRGLAQILRTLPVVTAHRLAAALGRPDAPVTLFCEMEPIDLAIPANRIRRTSYEGAGFLSVGHEIGYRQPDFRPPETIDADPGGAKPILFDILFRRVGREEERALSGADLAASIASIYAMYAAGFRRKDMQGCLDWLAAFRNSAAPHYPLRSPTFAP